MFEASNVALQFVAAIRPIVEAIALHDPHLADQLRRATTASALNTAESGRRVGADKRNRARVAAGECDEAVHAVRIGIAWGWVTEAAAANAFALGDRLLAMLWRLANPRR